jgi:polysaccharide deacetylase family sporulation protein PdaB
MMSGGIPMRVLILRKRTLVIAALITALIIAGAVLIAVLWKGTEAAPTIGKVTAIPEYELNVLAGRQRELPVYYVDTQEKLLALTVDAAWEDDKTEFILETLAKHDIKATFFLCGVWVKAYPEDVKAIAAAGHEIGNHSLTHPHMNQLDAAGVQKEIKELDDQIESLTGKRCTLFRAPFGEYNDTVIKAARDIGYEPIQWNLDTIDWKKERSAGTILDTVLPKLSPGSIILCHNNGYEIKNYLPTLIEKAQEQGYRFVTISELLLGGETEIDANGMQKRKEG